MSLYETVRNALDKNPNTIVIKDTAQGWPIQVTHDSPRYPLSSAYTGATMPEDTVELIEILVAPQKGIYNSSGLQEFMESMVPNLHPVDEKPFHTEVGVMDYGFRVYEETIGDDERVIEDGEQFAFPTIVPYTRRILVKLYPDVRVGRKSSNHEFPFYTDRVGNTAQIRASQFNEWIRNFFNGAHFRKNAEGEI